MEVCVYKISSGNSHNIEREVHRGVLHVDMEVLSCLFFDEYLLVCLAKKGPIRMPTFFVEI